MQPFEYLSVLISIILGLALTQLLTGAGRLIRHRDRVRFYFPLGIWLCVLFVVIVQTWWTMFSLRTLEDWTIDKFLVVLLHPMFVYLLVELALPDFDATGGVDLKANYLRQSPVFFGALTCLLAVSLLRPLLLTGGLAPALDLAFHGVFIALSLVAIVWRRECFHRLISPLVIVLLVAYVATNSLELR